LSILVLRRLESLPEPGREIAQSLVDRLFQHLDAGLREMGVGDLRVPKRMKKLAEAFGGRSGAYRAALAQGNGAFAAALARNIYGTDVADGRVVALADYAGRAMSELDRADLARILADPWVFPDPEMIDVRLS
jgi:cytochrome b pre-mRNA-processing protein 3